MRVLPLALGWLLAAHAVARAVRAPKQPHVEHKIAVHLNGRQIAETVRRHV